MMRHLIILFMFLSSGLAAQTSRPDSSAVVTLTTSPVGADVYIDTLFVGKSPLQQLAVAPGRHLIRMYYPSLFAWNAVLTQDSVDVPAGGRLEKQISVGDVVLVASDPPGGSVWRDKSFIGRTPLYLHSAASLEGSLFVTRDGFDSLQVPLENRNNGMIHIHLTPNNSSDVVAHTSDVLSPDGHLATDHWRTYASGVTMITSGVVSAYLKDRANRDFDRYIQTNNPSDLSSTRALDRAAAATLILSSISFGILAYLLLSE